MAQNNYNGDAHAIAVYSFEDGAVGADEKLAHNLISEGGELADTTNFVEKSASLLSDDGRYLYRNNGISFFSGSESFSVACRLRIITADFTDRWICGVRDASSYNTAWTLMLQLGSDLVVHFYDSAGNTNWFKMVPGISGGKWYCFAFSYNHVTKQVKARLYDTVLQIEYIEIGTPFVNHYWNPESTAPFFVGGLPEETPTHCFKGNIDELVLWDKVIDISVFADVCAFLYNPITLDDDFASTLSEKVDVSLGMTFPVLPYPPDYPLTHQIVRELLNNDFGDGYCQTLSYESSFSRANGTGTVSSHYGLNRFVLQFNKRLAGANKVANNLWTFFRNRLSSGNMPFYIYNPPESNFVIDLTGNSTVGRYLVRLRDPNQVLNREYFAYNLFNFGGIELIEDRNAFWNRFSLISLNINDNLTYNDNVTVPFSTYIYNITDALYWDYQDSVDKVYRALIEKRPSDNYSNTLSESVNKIFRGKILKSINDALTLSDNVNIINRGKIIKNINDALTLSDNADKLLSGVGLADIADQLNAIYQDAVSILKVNILLYNTLNDTLSTVYNDSLWDGKYDDSFAGPNDSSPNPIKWNVVNGSPTIQSNKLRLSVVGAGTQDFITSKAVVTGDFDVQVDYTLVVDGNVNAWGVDLTAIIDSTHGVLMRYQSIGDGTYYAMRGYINGGSWNYDGTSIGYIASGKLRIVRLGTQFYVYWWNGSSWTAQGTFVNINANDVTVGLEASNWNDNPNFTWDAQNFIFNVGP